jgi:hypothetical protein
MAANDRRRRLADDAARVTGYLAAVLVDARRARAEIPDNVTASVGLWRAWAAQLATWADEQDPTPDQEPGPRRDPGLGGPPLVTRPHDWPPDKP